MHVPKYFEVKDQAVIEQFIKENSFATLITKGSDYPVGTHIPMELELNENGEQVLWGHISKANPQWQDFEKDPRVLVVFLSHIHHYISSSWYNHPNVPTWNYLSIHISGRLRLLEGDVLWESLRRLTDKYEQYSRNPVSLNSLPESVQKQVNGIVGFEISIDRIDAAFKLSQNRNEEDFNNILQELRSRNDSLGRMMAEQMEANRKSNM